MPTCGLKVPEFEVRRREADKGTETWGGSVPSFVVHGLVPLLLVLALRLAPPKAALAMLPFTWLPDLDFWIGVHRATTSNVFILLPTIYLWWRWRKTRPTRSMLAGLATFYLASHLIMDLFAGGIVPFWPLSNRTVFWFFLIQINTQTGERDITNEVGTQEGAPQVVEVFTWLSPTEAAMLALTVFAVGTTLAWQHWPWRDRDVDVEAVDE